MVFRNKSTFTGAQQETAFCDRSQTNGEKYYNTGQTIRYRADSCQIAHQEEERFNKLVKTAKKEFTICGNCKIRQNVAFIISGFGDLG